MNIYDKTEYRTFTAEYNLGKEIEKLEIADAYKEKLIGANIKIALPKKVEDKKNNRLNVYIADAKDIGGEQRICYLTVGDENIEIIEYKGARGDRYSGFYKILLELMEEKEIPVTNEENRKVVNLEFIDDIVEIFEKISDGYRKNEYVLKDTGETFSKTLGGQVYEYPIRYYEFSKGVEENKEDEILSEIRKKIDEECLVMVEGNGDQFIEAYRILEDMQSYIGTKLSESKGRKEALERIRGIRF